MKIGKTARTLAFGAAMLLSSAANAANVYTLRLFQVDDLMQAYITNSYHLGTLMFEKTFAPDHPAVGISPFITTGLNTIDLALFNGPSGYTYGYDFQINGVSFAKDSCGTFNMGGCDNDRYGEGLVWTDKIRFNVDSNGYVSGVPEPATWAMMITGFGMAGWMLRRNRSRLATASA